jgi:hypothetical protein
MIKLYLFGKKVLSQVAYANTIAHELGFHAIAGKSDPITPEKKGDDIVDRNGCTHSLVKALGSWSKEVCDAIKSALGVS